MTSRPTILPQWSPPLKGGSTQADAARTRRVTMAPQWSPPLKGGSTLPASRGGRRRR